MAAKASGGAHTSRTMLLSDLTTVFSACPAESEVEDYKDAIVNLNVAGKGSLSSRQRTFRYLRELYWLSPAEPSFRALRRLWVLDPTGRPLLALLTALTNDRAFAATSAAVLPLPVGEQSTSVSLAAAVEATFPGNYSEAIRSKIGRNALSSWTQAGYLRRVGRGPALRQRVTATPGSVAMLLVLGSNTGLAGERLFNSSLSVVLDSAVSALHDAAHAAARKGWLEFRSRGAVTEVDVSALTAQIGDARIAIDWKAAG